MAGTKAKQIGLVLKGYMQAEDDTYTNRRGNLVVINQAHNAEASSNSKGGEDLVNALEKAKIDFIKKHIRLRSDGRYEYRIRENGKDISKSDKDFNTVINMALGKVKKRKRQQTKKYPTIVEYSWKYYKIFRAKNKGLSTQKEYTNIIDNHIYGYFDTKTIDKATGIDLQEFVNQVKGDRIREKVFNFIVNMFAKAFALGDLKKNPALALELPQGERKEKKRGLLYDEQVALLNALKDYDEDFQRFIMFSLVLGSRREETCCFKLEDINEEKQLIFIHGTKTENAPRHIKISASMIAYLKKAGKSSDEGYFEKTASAYYHRLQRLYKKLKITNVDVHSLRRTCSTNLYYLGVTDKQRQQVMGHASIVTTNDIYTFLEHDMTKEKIKNLYKSLYFSEY